MGVSGLDTLVNEKARHR